MSPLGNSYPVGAGVVNPRLTGGLTVPPPNRARPEGLHASRGPDYFAPRSEIGSTIAETNPQSPFLLGFRRPQAGGEAPNGGWKAAAPTGTANVLEFSFKSLQRGAVAQLEEYLNGIQGVVGSNPISSTNLILIPCRSAAIPRFSTAFGPYGIPSETFTRRLRTSPRPSPWRPLPTGREPAHRCSTRSR